jgi:hypothetical protein
MSERRDLIGKPEEENTASSSTQSASGLGAGTPEGGPVQPHETARRTDPDDRQERERRELREQRERSHDTAGEDGVENPLLPEE